MDKKGFGNWEDFWLLVWSRTISTCLLFCKNYVLISSKKYPKFSLDAYYIVCLYLLGIVIVSCQFCSVVVRDAIHLWLNRGLGKESNRLFCCLPESVFCHVWLILFYLVLHFFAMFGSVWVWAEKAIIFFIVCRHS